MLSNKIVIRADDGHNIVDCDTGKKINKGYDINIADHVWIGYGVSILKRSNIGKNSILGSKTLVIGQEIPENSIAVGSPVRIVKKNITWRK